MRQKQTTQSQIPSCAPPDFISPIQFTTIKREDESQNHVEEEVVETSGIKVNLIEKWHHKTQFAQQELYIDKTYPACQIY